MIIKGENYKDNEGPVVTYTTRHIQALILYVGHLLRLVEDNNEVDMLAPSTYDVELFFAHFREMCNHDYSVEKAE